MPKLSPTQLRVLRYASEGRLKCDARGCISHIEGVEAFEVPTVLASYYDGRFVWRSVAGESYAVAEVTPKGAALLEEQGEA